MNVIENKVLRVSKSGEQSIRSRLLAATVASIALMVPFAASAQQVEAAKPEAAAPTVLDLPALPDTAEAVTRDLRSAAAEATAVPGIAEPSVVAEVLTLPELPAAEA